ncbi:response regulator [Thaumasiovibrio sp. DFM-14]|uniref:response regulator n=1 Tax=Thaumasiovibrio sp. DFM-14 TaxID=3384792 RepID=UPI0039A05E49
MTQQLFFVYTGLYSLATAVLVWGLNTTGTDIPSVPAYSFFITASYFLGLFSLRIALHYTTRPTSNTAALAPQYSKEATTPTTVIDKPTMRKSASRTDNSEQSRPALNVLYQDKADQDKTEPDVDNSASTDLIQIQQRLLSGVREELYQTIINMHDLNELLQRGRLDNQQQQVATQLSQHTQAALLMLDDVSEFSQENADSISLNHHPFNLDILLQNIISELPLTEHNKEVLLNVHPCSEYQLTGDPLRIKIILQNLLAHALNRINAGEVKLNISLTPLNDSTCTLSGSVCDNGNAIPQAQQTKLYSNILRTQPAKYPHNSAYGQHLATTHLLLKQMNGHLALSSIEDKGNEFFFSMTLACSPVNTLPVAAQQVLLIEDSHASSKVIQYLCKQFTWQVHHASSAKEALTILEHHEFDVILINYALPDVDGITLCQHFKAQYPTARRILLVPINNKNLRQEINNTATDNLVNHVLYKPFTPAQLQQAVAKTRHQTQRLSSNSKPLEHQLVLLVDSHLSSQRITKGRLQHLGATVQCAGTHFDVLSQLNNPVRPDVILFNSLPNREENLSFCQYIQRHANRPSTPVIALIHAATPELHQQYLAAGFADCLIKPCNTTTLVNTIIKHIDHSSSPDHPLTAMPHLSERIFDLAREKNINILAALRIHNGNIKATKNSLFHFIQAAPSLMTNLVKAIAINNHNQAGKLLYQLKSMAIQSGVEALASKIRLYEAKFLETHKIAMTGIEQYELTQIMQEYLGYLRELIAIWPTELDEQQQQDAVAILEQLQQVALLFDNQSEGADLAFEKIKRDLQDHYPDEEEKLRAAIHHQDYKRAAVICHTLIERARH